MQVKNIEIVQNIVNSIFSVSFFLQNSYNKAVSKESI